VRIVGASNLYPLLEKVNYTAMIIIAIKLHDVFEEKSIAFDSTGYLASLFYALSQLSQCLHFIENDLEMELQQASAIEVAFEQLRRRKEDETVVRAIFDLLRDMTFFYLLKIAVSDQDAETIAELFSYYLTKSDVVTMNAIVRFMRDHMSERFEDDSFQSRYLFWTINHESTSFVVFTTDAFLKHASSSFKSNYILRGM
jgi:hypothetical protein